MAAHLFCLAGIDQQKCPSGEAEKEDLFRAGLGEKEVCFDNTTILQEKFHGMILTHFPGLRDGGGFRFLKDKKWTLYHN